MDLFECKDEYGKGLRGQDTLSAKTMLSKLFSLPSEKGSNKSFRRTA